MADVIIEFDNKTGLPVSFTFKGAQGLCKAKMERIQKALALKGINVEIKDFKPDLTEQGTVYTRSQVKQT